MNKINLKNIKTIVLTTFVIIVVFISTVFIVQFYFIHTVIQKAMADANVYFSDNVGNPISEIDPDQDLYITVNDNSINFDESSVDSIEVDIKSAQGDVLQVELLETDVDSGIFINSTGIQVDVAPANISDSILQVKRGKAVSLSYRNRYFEDITTQEENRLRIRHYARLAGDSTAESCDDTYYFDDLLFQYFGYYDGNELTFDPNNTSAVTYIPTDPTEFGFGIPWQSDSDDGQAICTLPYDTYCDSGSVDWYSLSDNDKHSSMSYLDSDDFIDINDTDFYSWDEGFCSGWEITLFDIPVKSENFINSVNIEFLMDSTYRLELTTQNDIFLLVYDDTTDEWEVLDYYADSEYEYLDPLGWDENYTLDTAVSDYIFEESGQNYIRFALVGYNFTQYSSGTLFFDKFVANVGYESSGMDILNVEAGTASISGTVWDDANLNGTIDSGEDRFSNLLVGLYDSSNTPIAVTRTNSNGEYSFTGLDEGDYTVYQVDELDYTSPSGVSNNQTNVTVPEGGNITDIDFGDGEMAGSTTTIYVHETIYQFITQNPIVTQTEEEQEESEETEPSEGNGKTGKSGNNNKPKQTEQKLPDTSRDEEPKSIQLPITQIVTVTGSIAAIGLTTIFLDFSIFDAFGFILSLIPGVRIKGSGKNIVYNAISKEPIDFAIVRIFDQNNKLVHTSVTNEYGVYSTPFDKGTFRITVSKSGYKFPSAIITGAGDDPLMNTYHGELVENPGNTEIQATIPIDPTSSKQAYEGIRRRILYTVKNLAFVIMGLLYFAGLSWTIYRLTISIDVISILSILSYIIMMIVWITQSKKQSWKYGKVTNPEDRPMNGLIIRLSENKYGTVVAKRVVDEYGLYRFIVNPGEYKLNIFTKRLDKLNDDNLLLEKENDPSIIAEDIIIS
ncbi:hypothetical protein JW887_01175 [Candidatus Dojkabacteria bacterium]|nr:hypothetical protein [Candidatus Dojkabacteria bacterium]